MTSVPYVPMLQYLVHSGAASSETGGFELVVPPGVDLEGHQVLVWTESDVGSKKTQTLSSAESLATDETIPFKKYKATMSWQPTRTPANCPEGMPIDAWLEGVSREELPGFRKVSFLYSPKECWIEQTLWVSSTTTGGDCKAWLSHHVQMHHADTMLVGLTSQKKLDWRQKILDPSPENWAPGEDRVLIPSNARLDVFMEF